jgi:hypothetical protein
LLGGLWHGANFTFVVWGGLHGTALAVERALLGKQAADPAITPRRIAAVFVTFHFVTLAWVFFRSETFAHASLFFSRLASLTTYHPNLDPRVLAVLGIGLASHYVPERWFAAFRDRFAASPAVLQAAGLFVAGLALRALASAEAVPFVYFQF